MDDEDRLCVCGRLHPYGIIRQGRGREPLYGGRPIPGCKDFQPASESKVPAFVQDTRELWARTGDLDAQAELATRMVVARIRGLTSPSEQWVESLGFLFSQLTSMRGALIKGDAKLANFVAHADEVVESMKRVTQLAKRLESMNEQLAELSGKVGQLAAQSGIRYSAELEAFAHFGLVPFADYPKDSSMLDDDDYATVHAKLHHPPLGERKDEPVELDEHPDLVADSAEDLEEED